MKLLYSDLHLRIFSQGNAIYNNWSDVYHQVVISEILVKYYICWAVFYKAVLKTIAGKHWFKVPYYFCFLFSHDEYLTLNSICVVIFFWFTLWDIFEFIVFIFYTRKILLILTNNAKSKEVSILNNLVYFSLILPHYSIYSLIKENKFSAVFFKNSTTEFKMEEPEFNRNAKYDMDRK